MADLILLKDHLALQPEIWKPVEGLVGYDVSTLGRIRSYWIRVRGTKWKDCFKVVLSDVPRLLKTPANSKHGYVDLLLKTDAGVRHFRVHRLIAKAFLPNPRNLPMVNHLNLVRTDNRVENLEWADSLRNNGYKVLCGTAAHGTRHGMSKLTEQVVREIRYLLSKGTPTSEVARRFKVHKSTIQRAINGRTWRRVA